jgi:hypothetical protein
VELSAEILHSTLEGVRVELSDGRKHARVPLRHKVRITPYEDGVLGTPIQVWTRDVSLSGLCIIHHKAIRKGRHFVIRLPRQEDTHVLLLCTVRSCTEVVAEVFNIGASYVEVAETAGVDHRKLVVSHFQPDMVDKVFPPDAAQKKAADEIQRIRNAILS